MKLRDNFEKYKRRGLIPSATKGKQRWRITYADGKKEIFMSAKMVKKEVNKDSCRIAKVEKKRVLIELVGETKKDFIEKDATDWHDVSSFYL